MWGHVLVAVFNNHIEVKNKPAVSIKVDDTGHH